MKNLFKSDIKINIEGDTWIINILKLLTGVPMTAARILKETKYNMH